MSQHSAVCLLAFIGAASVCAADQNPVTIGPVALNGTSYASAATVLADALGSGVDGPLTAQTGLTVNISKDNWWTGGMVGEIDGLNVLLRQNGPGSDASGILINVQNQGHGFLSATEFSSTIVDPASNTLTHGIDVQEGVLNRKTNDYIGAVYTADFGALSTGVLIQNSSPTASWQYALQYQKNGATKFSVDGAGNVVGANAHFASLFVHLSAPAHSSSPCSPGQLAADQNFVYVCVAPNRWKRSALGSF
ncbi:MAG TPA: hypothetical protein VGR92_05520 [Steroidobacteraceae bacterium]|nr:hypothetical protein [Steroidobacteraceae bacterium]